MQPEAIETSISGLDVLASRTSGGVTTLDQLTPLSILQGFLPHGKRALIHFRAPGRLDAAWSHYILGVMHFAHSPCRGRLNL